MASMRRVGEGGASSVRPRPRSFVAAVAGMVVLVVTALVATACAPASRKEPDMDKTSVVAAIEALPGVVSADVAAYNTGRPGAYALRVAVTVDERGRAGLGEVVGGAVRAVAAEIGDYESATFEVTAPDDAGEPVVLTLARYRDAIPFDDGEYRGSTLTLTSAEVVAAASR